MEENPFIIQLPSIKITAASKARLYWIERRTIKTRNISSYNDKA